MGHLLSGDPLQAYRISYNRVTMLHVCLHAYIMAQEESLSLYYARFNIDGLVKSRKSPPPCRRSR